MEKIIFLSSLIFLYCNKIKKEGKFNKKLTGSTGE